MQSDALASLVLIVVATAGLLACGGDDRPTAERWNEICRDDTRVREASPLVTAGDFRRFVDRGARALKRLQEGAPADERGAKHHRALTAFAAQRKLEQRFLAQTRRRPIAEVALAFRRPADAAARRVRTAFAAAGTSACTGRPYLR